MIQSQGCLESSIFISNDDGTLGSRHAVTGFAVWVPRPSGRGRADFCIKAGRKALFVKLSRRRRPSTVIVRGLSTCMAHPTGIGKCDPVFSYGGCLQVDGRQSWLGGARLPEAMCQFLLICAEGAGGLGCREGVGRPPEGGA